jgi:hypothetical protein
MIDLILLALKSENYWKKQDTKQSECAVIAFLREKKKTDTTFHFFVVCVSFEEFTKNKLKTGFRRKKTVLL